MFSLYRAFALIDYFVGGEMFLLMYPLAFSELRHTSLNDGSSVIVDVSAAVQHREEIFEGLSLLVAQAEYGC